MKYDILFGSVISVGSLFKQFVVCSGSSNIWGTFQNILPNKGIVQHKLYFL